MGFPEDPLHKPATLTFPIPQQPTHQSFPDFLPPPTGDCPGRPLATGTYEMPRDSPLTLLTKMCIQQPHWGCSGKHLATAYMHG